MGSTELSIWPSPLKLWLRFLLEMMNLLWSLIAEAIDEIGADGVISVESSCAPETSIIVEEGSS